MSVREARPETVKAAAHVVANEITDDLADRDFFAGFIVAAIDDGLRRLVTYSAAVRQTTGGLHDGGPRGGVSARGPAHDRGTGRGT